VDDCFPNLQYVVLVRFRVWGYGKAGGGEGKRLGSREAGFDAGKGRGSAGERRPGC